MSFFSLVPGKNIFLHSIYMYAVKIKVLIYFLVITGLVTFFNKLTSLLWAFAESPSWKKDENIFINKIKVVVPEIYRAL